VGGGGGSAGSEGESAARLAEERVTLVDMSTYSKQKEEEGVFDAEVEVGGLIKKAKSQ
jgi:hypothetical protein